MDGESLLELFLESDGVCTDTRATRSGTLFFALKGDSFDGNKFANSALEQGCLAAIVDDKKLEGVPGCIRVSNVLQTLQRLAFDYRNTFNIPFFAITGSNGKTTTKELLREVLKTRFNVHATLGNLNNHIGVPLTLLSMPRDTNIAIIELGANHVGEIASLCKISAPSHGIITNVGLAHLEGFGGFEGVKKAKGELYDYLEVNGGIAFINTDEPHLADMAGSVNAYNYSTDSLGIRIEQQSPLLQFSWGKGTDRYLCSSQMTGTYNIPNYAAAIAIGQFFGIADQIINDALSSYTPDNKRSETVRTAHNEVILDAYNANPTSMEHALINLSQMPNKKKFFVIGDMLELGETSLTEHQRILDLASELNLEGITVGKEFSEVHGIFPNVPNVDEARNYIEKRPVNDKWVLVKGSRGIRLEELMDLL
jgi:UDP-N-acetylmuramoyl-tripeptide--D-alanyl-D-alanine ligase